MHMYATPGCQLPTGAYVMVSFAKETYKRDYILLWCEKLWIAIAGFSFSFRALEVEHNCHGP